MRSPCRRRPLGDRSAPALTGEPTQYAQAPAFSSIVIASSIESAYAAYRADRVIPPPPGDRVHGVPPTPENWSTTAWVARFPGQRVTP